jgi:hypothetical protein
MIAGPPSSASQKYPTVLPIHPHEAMPNILKDHLSLFAKEHALVPDDLERSLAQCIELASDPPLLLNSLRGMHSKMIAGSLRHCSPVATGTTHSKS